jgi:uncharacterized protein YecE (DUF72 family)
MREGVQAFLRNVSESTCQGKLGQLNARRHAEMPPVIGCCGWSEAQARYLSHFPVIEIQSTFYDPPAVKVAAKWRALASPEFSFCMKAWQLITHTPSSPTYRRLRSPVSSSEHDLFGSFRDTEQVWNAWQKTREIAEALRASVLVFQCPASFQPTRVNAKNLSRFFHKIGPQTFRVAWEPRGPWPASLVYELCAEHGLIHCVDPFVNRSVYGNSLYWRLHGKGAYSYRYTDADLSELKAMLPLGPTGQSGYVLFNNLSMKDDADRFGGLLARTP